MKIRKLVKRITALVAVAALAVVAVGCGKSTSSQATDKVVHLAYWHVNAQTQGGAAVNQLVAQFNRTHKNIQVTAKYNPNMYQGLMQNLQSAQASNKMPDVVQVGWAYTNYFADNFKYVTPTEMQKQFGKGNDFIKDNFTSRTLSFARDSKGRLVGLPYSLSTPILYYNKALLEQAGVQASTLTTWEGVAAAAKKVKVASGNYGVYIQEPGDTWAQQALMLSAGAKIKQGQRAAFASADGIKAYQLYQDMVVKDQTALHAPWAQGMDAFVNGKVAMAYTTVAQAAHVKKSANFEVAALPSPGFKGHHAVVPVGGSMLATTAQDKAKQRAAWVFERYMYENSSLVTWSKGTGYLPPTKEALASKEFADYLKANPMLSPAASQLTTAVPWTSFAKDGLQAEQTMIDARDRILAGNPVKATLKKAQEMINAKQK